MLTRKDFRLEADRIGNVEDRAIRKQMTKVYCNLAKANNPRFSKTIFVAWIESVSK